MPNPKGTIFINYRKDDSRWNSLALYNELQKYFGKDQLFKDFNTISPGDDFVKSIESALYECNVLLVIIGPEWLHIKDQSGKRRLEDPDDFVHLEISTALNRNIKVVPVLIDNTPMPKEDELPERLKPLYRRQFVEIDNTRFEDDVRNLAEAIKKMLPNPKPNPDPEPKPNPKPNPDPNPTPIPQPFKPAAIDKPSNNLVLAIFSVILCLPFGIVSILSASKVDALYAKGHQSEALKESIKAKNWGIYGIIGFVFIYIIYAIALYGNSLSTP